MRNPWPKIVVVSLVAALAAVWMFRSVSPAEPLNHWAILSFAALGACLGCLWSEPNRLRP